MTPANRTRTDERGVTGPLSRGYGAATVGSQGERMMRTLVSLTALAAACLLGAPAHALPALDAIDCTGWLDPGAVTTPGTQSYSGTVTCTLSRADSSFGYTQY